MSYDLVVFDPHTHPEDDFARFDWLGQMILEEKPRSVIFGGDTSNLDSLSSYDKHKSITLREDLAAMHEAQRRVFQPVEDWTRRQRSHRHAGHVPRKVLIKGNHEERAERKVREDPHGFGSVVDFDDIAGFIQNWDEIHQYGDGANVNGVYYTHCVVGVMGRALAFSTVLKQSSTHTIVGHQHSLKSDTVPVPGGVRFVMSAPAFIPNDYVPAYAEKAQRGWSRGLLRVYPNGPTQAPDLDYVSMDRLERMYG